MKGGYCGASVSLFPTARFSVLTRCAAAFRLKPLESALKRADPKTRKMDRRGAWHQGSKPWAIPAFGGESPMNGPEVGTGAGTEAET